jgi:hypothetical protein
LGKKTGIGHKTSIDMETHESIIDEAVNLLMSVVNFLDREKVRMVDSYPNWDEVDTAEVRDGAIAQINAAISKLGQL